jgi:hypothetical protein
MFYSSAKVKKEEKGKKKLKNIKKKEISSS